MIELLPMQIPFENLVSPGEFTGGLATLISILMGVIAYAGTKFRSPAIFAVWSLGFMVLILTFITSLPFVWFWIVMLLNALTISVSASVRYLL
jgi:hypothetical protein